MFDIWLNRTAAFITLITFFSSLFLSSQFQIDSGPSLTFISFGDISLFLSVILLLIGSTIFAIGFSWMARFFYSADPPTAIFGLLLIGVTSGFQSFFFCFGITGDSLDLSEIKSLTEIPESPFITFFIYLSISLGIEVVFITFYFYKHVIQENGTPNFRDVDWISAHIGVLPLGPQIIMLSFILLVLSLFVEAGAQFKYALLFSLTLCLINVAVTRLFIESAFRDDV